MIDPPRITQTAALLTAYVHVTVPREEIRTVMGPGLDEVRAGRKPRPSSAVGDCRTEYCCGGPLVYAPSQDAAGHLRF